MLNEHDELRSLLARIRRRWFGFTVLTTIGRATAAAAIPLAAAAAIVWAAAPAGWRLVAVLAHRVRGRGRGGRARASSACSGGRTTAAWRASSRRAPVPRV